MKCTVLLGNGGGDEVFVIDQPGKYQGRIFWNFHEDGLASLDSIDEYIEEEGLDAKPDKFIPEMPFFENPVAKSLDELWLNLQVYPREDPAAMIAKLKPA